MNKRLFHFLIVWLAVAACGLLGASTEGVSTAGNAPKIPSYRCYGSWCSSNIGGGGGGSLYRVVHSTQFPERYYVYIDVGGIYRSDDKGNSWHAIHGKNLRRGDYDVRDIDLDPRNPDVLLAALSSSGQPEESNVFRTEDGGVNWKPVASGSFFGNGAFKRSGTLFARSRTTPDTILLATQGGGVLRSTDNGLTWQNVPLAVYATNLLMDRKSDQRLWLCSQPMDVAGTHYSAGFFTTEDQGRTWLKLSNESPISIVQDPANPEGLYGIFDNALIRISRDAGKTWIDCSSGLPNDAGSKISLSLSHLKYTALAAGPDYVAVSSAMGDLYVLKSTEAQWVRIPRESVRYANWYGAGKLFGWCTDWIEVDPADSNHWLLTDWFALYQSFDGGKNWTLTVDGIEPTVLLTLAQDPNDPQIVHLGMADNGYFRSSDGGVTFQRVSSDKPNNAKCLDVSRTDSKRVYMVGSSLKANDQASRQVYISADGGLTWNPSPMTGLPEMRKSFCNSVVVDPRNATIVYLAVSGAVTQNGGGIYKSTDGGRNWLFFGEGLPIGDRLFAESIWAGGGPEICMDSAGHLLAIGQQSHEIFRYDANLSKWMPVKLQSKGEALSLAASMGISGQFYAAVPQDGVYKTKDGGRKWEKIYSGNARVVQTDRVHPERVAIATVDTILFSDDGGRTWIDLDTENKFPHPPVKTLAFAGNRLLAGTVGSGCFWRDLPQKSE